MNFLTNKTLMKQINHRGYLLVEVPEEIKDVHLYRVNNEAIMLKWIDIKHPMNIHDVVRVDYYNGNLENYKWPEIIGKGNEITEEVWAQILVKEDLYWEMSYRRYPEPGQELAFQEHIADTATESGHSLIKSHGMKPETTLILKLRNHE